MNVLVSTKVVYQHLIDESGWHMQLWAQIFFSELAKIFAFLATYGFQYRDDALEETPLYARASFTGKNVRFIFSYDVKDKVVECYVARVEGEYSCHLYSFLVKYSGFRGTIKNSVPGKDALQIELEEVLTTYANLIKIRGKILLEDKANALPD